MNALTPWARRAAFAVVPLVTFIVASPSANSADGSIEGLKRAYLACEVEAAASRLGDGDAMQCSIIYEELKQRGFDGDFRSLRTWYESVRPSMSSMAAQ